MTMRWLSWMPLLLCSCAAKGTYHIAQAQAAVELARADEAEEFAVYAWTMAESYLIKAREEYAYADYEAAAKSRWGGRGSWRDPEDPWD